MLTGKRIIVLGGSSGMGFATALSAASVGAEVVIVSSNPERIDAALKKLPENASGYQVDLGNEEAIKAFFESAGYFDHLIYTAGDSFSFKLVKELELSEAHQFFNVRYWGSVAAVKYATPFINIGGSITLTSAIVNQRPKPTYGIAACINGAVEGFAKAMAVELAPIRVNVVSPGIIRTELWSRHDETTRESIFANIGKSLPLQRIGTPSDAAQAYLYLMNQDFCTGQIITIDGGATII